MNNIKQLKTDFDNLIIEKNYCLSDPEVVSKAIELENILNNTLVNIPRHSRGLFINGHSPTLLATRESALVRLPLAKGSLLAASKLGFIS